jgi:hypothetical protein
VRKHPEKKLFCPLTHELANKWNGLRQKTETDTGDWIRKGLVLDI